MNMRDGFGPDAAATPPATRPWRPATSLLATSFAFTVAYGLANQLTSLRDDVGLGVFAWERAIPFVGWTIVPYLSIIAFFALSFFIDADARSLRRHVVRLLLVLAVSVACYAAFPLRFTFARPETDGAVGLLFDLLGACDLPYNRAPSLHIGVLSVLWARFVPCLQGWPRACLHAWFLLIAVSVLTTYQHHVLDVPAGALLGVLVIAITAGRGREASRRIGGWFRLRLLPTCCASRASPSDSAASSRTTPSR
ncbi:MAG: hypothetical protein H7Y61_13860 [Rhizobiales bacterium]|nr:hypothetical protein [Rhizobacter sp.]